MRPDAFPDTSPHGSHSTVYAYASWRSEGLDRDDQRIIVVVMRTADPIEAPNMTDDELAETLHRFTVEDPNGRGRFIAFHASCRWFDHELVRIGPPPSSFPPDDPWCGGAWVNFHHDRLTWGEVRYFPSQL